MAGSVGFEPTERDWLRPVPLQTECIKPDSANYPNGGTPGDRTLTALSSG